MIIERLSLDNKYNADEASIHLARYIIAKNYCKGLRVLDAGCGEGYGSKLLVSWGADYVLGVDIDKDSVEKASNIFGGEKTEYISANISNMSFVEDSSFDMAVSFEALEHVEDSEAFLREIKRIVKPDGIIIISCPNDHYYYEEHEKNPYHLRKYSLDEFIVSAESILGNASSVLVAGKLRGYYNRIYKDSVSGYNKENHGSKQIDMVNSINSIDTYIVPEEITKHVGSYCYYAGIWDFSSNGYMPKAVSVVYPSSFDGRDEIIEAQAKMIDERVELITSQSKMIDERDVLIKKQDEIIASQKTLLDKRALSRIKRFLRKYKKSGM